MKRLMIMVPPLDFLAYTKLAIGNIESDKGLRDIDESSLKAVTIGLQDVADRSLVVNELQRLQQAKMVLDVVAHNALMEPMERERSPNRRVKARVGYGPEQIT